MPCELGKTENEVHFFWFHCPFYDNLKDVFILDRFFGQDDYEILRKGAFFKADVYVLDTSIKEIKNIVVKFKYLFNAFRKINNCTIGFAYTFN